MRFDAYAATIKGPHLGEVANLLAGSIGGIVSSGKPMRRYANTLSIDAGPRMAAWLGLDTTSGAVYVEGQGEPSPDLAAAIRQHFPVHACARADVCQDANKPGAFDAFMDLVRANKGQRVKGGYVALPDDAVDGKTWAAGARGGIAYCRVYEAGKHPDRIHMGMPDWARLEF